MSSMFLGASFIGDISKWNVSSVKDMGAMFYGCPFQGDISQWPIRNDADLRNMIEKNRLNGFEKPSVFHWLASIGEDGAEGVMLKPLWQAHADAFKPLALSVTRTAMEAAVIMEGSWLNKDFFIEPQKALENTSMFW